MPSTVLAPEVKTQPAIKNPVVEDVTVIMPFYDRLQYLKHYLDEGFWNGLKVQLVCDGSEPMMLEHVEGLLASQGHMALYSYEQNRGPAFARTTGINLAQTECITFCDDDDFLSDAPPFLNKSTRRLHTNSDVLFTAMPLVYAFNESLNHRLQYDRTSFHGKTGRELLMFLVKTGEMCVLTLGSVFRKNDIEGLYPETFFKVSEDYTFLVRLCAKYPDRKVHVEDKGFYMRLVAEGSLSSKASYSLEKIVMHLVSMFVGAYYLFKMGLLRTPVFQHILRERGAVLQQSYGKGNDAAKMMAGLMEGKNGPFTNPEQNAAYKFLQAQKMLLPPEFLWLVGWNAGHATRIADWNSI